MFSSNINELNRQRWLQSVLEALPEGLRILDAGAGELSNRRYCRHLDYVSQDICEYEGAGDGKGLQKGVWDTSQVDLVCDIASIPEPDASFDAVLCSEVLEHVTDPIVVLDEFSRLLKPGGRLILTAPFASLVHFAPYHFSTGFSRYWYEHHLPSKGFVIDELTPNGDWFLYCRQEMLRLVRVERALGSWSWPLAGILAALGAFYFKVRANREAPDLACFGWHCVAVKQDVDR